jgi:hypothetical protein
VSVGRRSFPVGGGQSSWPGTLLPRSASFLFPTSSLGLCQAGTLTHGGRAGTRGSGRDILASPGVEAARAGWQGLAQGDAVEAASCRVIQPAGTRAGEGKVVGTARIGRRPRSGETRPPNAEFQALMLLGITLECLTPPAMEGAEWRLLYQVVR